MKASTRRYLLRHGLGSLAFYALIVGGLYFLQDRLIYPGAFMEKPADLDVTRIDPAFREVVFAGDAGELFALHVTPAPGKPIVLAFHGNGMYPEDFFWIGSRLAGQGTGLLAPAYRGYPRSSGQPSEDGIHADASAAYRWIRETYPDSPVFVLGHSLGTGVAVRLASEQEVAEVLLLAPYLSISSVAWKRLPFIPVPWLATSPFRSDQAIGAVKAPITAWHGDDDEVIPLSSGRALMELARPGSAFTVLKGAGHGDIVMNDEVLDGIARLVAGGS